MAIKIIKRENVFNIEGQINFSTANYFKAHFTITLNSLKGLTLNINNVSEIDESGVIAMKAIYANAMKWDKPFSIVGKGSHALYKEFEQIKLA